MRRILALFVFMFCVHISTAVADCSTAVLCNPLTKIGGNDLTCKPTIQYLCTLADNTMFACVTNASALTATDTCQCLAGHFMETITTPTLETKCTACPANSYRADRNVLDKCAVCTGGTTSTATGQTTDCTGNCTNSANVATWATPQWDANTNTVTDVCKITSCNPGYHEESGACVGNAYTVKFNTAGGTPSTLTPVSCTYGTTCTWAYTITKEGAAFQYWDVAQDGVTTTSQATSSLPATFVSFSPVANGSSEITLTAHWLNCANADGVDTWAAGSCIVENCKFGYRKSSDTCIACNTAGRYCANNVEYACPKGWFCPTSGAAGATATYCKDSSAGAIGAMPSAAYTGKCMCMPGATSYAAAQNINGCYQKGKDASATQCADGNCSQFCQDGNKCFYLPTSVPYQSKTTFKAAYGGTCPAGAPTSVCQ